MYKLTVIIYSYNEGYNLPTCIDSVLNQVTDFDFHIMIADDGSTDGSLEILEEYGTRYGDDKIEILYSEQNQGKFKNALRAYKRLDCEYFCCIDADDRLIDMNHYQRAVDFLDSHNEYSMYHANEYRLYPDGNKKIEFSYSEGGYSYEDYLDEKGKVGNTPVTVLRNVFFNNANLEKLSALSGTYGAEPFRADSGLVVFHLQCGKAYYENRIVAEVDFRGGGLFSSLSNIQRAIFGAFAYASFHDFLQEKGEHTKKYVDIVKHRCRNIFVRGYETMNRGERILLSEFDKYAISFVYQWLLIHDVSKQEDYHLRYRIPFSLAKYSQALSEGVVIWGTGGGAADTIEKNHIPEDRILAFVDNDRKKWGTTFQGKRVISKEELKSSYYNSWLMVCSSYYKEIIRDIIEQDLALKDHIINIKDYEENVRNWFDD